MRYHLGGPAMQKILQLGDGLGMGNGYTVGLGEGLPGALEAQAKQQGWGGGEFTDCFLGRVSPELGFVA